MLVVVDSADGGLIARRPSQREQVLARLRASTLDRELARGVAPESAVGLAVRADQLVRPKTRRWLARSLQRILAEARRPTPRPMPMLASPTRERILEAADAMAALIDKLLRPGPVSTRGVAQVCLLLSDGCGPLYAPLSGQQLRDRLIRLSRELEPLPN
jgi:hypothetical protein